MKLLRFALDKLIRDKMADNMRSEDIIVHDRMLNDQEYLIALKKKLQEETEEILLASTPDQLAQECGDLLEVLYALIKASGLSLEQVEQARLAKKVKNGGFERKVFVSYVEHTQEHPATAYCRAQPAKYPEITPE